MALNEKLIELNDLERKVERAKQVYEPLLARWGKLDLASGLNTVPVQIIDRAVEPLTPVKPRRGLILIMGAVLGLAVGIQLAFLLERSYSKVRSVEDLEQLSGFKTVGVIPHMSGVEEKKLFLACQFDRESPAAEAYRSIRTSLLVSANGNGLTILMVTSALDKEGKTTTALNIASALAQAQKRVLLVDADMRRSFLHRPFGMERDHGLTAYLADGAEEGKVVRESEVSNLSVVTAGAPPQNPSELLGSERMLRFLQWAREHFDFVVLDSPPAVAVTDASVLAPLVDGILMVVRAGRTPRRALIHGRKLLENAKGNVIGAVLNDVSRQHERYYGYGYGYYHHYRDEDEEKVKRET